MSERAAMSGHELQNGHGPTASEQAEVEAARGQAESVTVQAKVDAEELLSRAHAHAELLRAHAEAARAEAASLRTEAAALRRAAHEGAARAIADAEALAAQMRAAADELRSVMEGQADQARAEIERVRSEAESFRRLLEADTDAALADAQRLRAEVQGLQAEINKLAAERDLLSMRAGGGFDVRREADAPLDELRRTIAMEVEQKLADVYAESRDRLARGESRSEFPAFDRGEAASRLEPRQDPDSVFPGSDLRERFRRAWDATYAEGTGQAPSSDQAAGGGPSGSGAPEPLIGSGGWRPSPGPSSPGASADSGAEQESPPADVGRHRRRFGRPA